MLVLGFPEDTRGRRKGRGKGPYDAVKHCFPALVLVLLDCLKEHLPVLGDGHLLINEELVAGLVVGLEGEAFREGWVHGIDIDVHYIS